MGMPNARPICIMNNAVRENFHGDNLRLSPSKNCFCFLIF